MTDTNSEWRFDVDDLDDDDDAPSDSGVSGLSTDNGDSDSSLTDHASFKGLTLLPLTLLGVFAFVETAALKASLVNVFGASGLATVLTQGLWAVGALTTFTIGVVGFIGLAALLIGIYRREPVPLTVFVVIFVWYTSATAGAIVFFPMLTPLVGFVLVSNIILYGGSFLIAGVLGVGVLSVI